MWRVGPTDSYTCVDVLLPGVSRPLRGFVPGVSDLFTLSTLLHSSLGKTLVENKMSFQHLTLNCGFGGFSTLKIVKSFGGELLIPRIFATKIESRFLSVRDTHTLDRTSPASSLTAGLMAAPQCSKWRVARCSELRGETREVSEQLVCVTTLLCVCVCVCVGWGLTRSSQVQEMMGCWKISTFALRPGSSITSDSLLPTWLHATREQQLNYQLLYCAKCEWAQGLCPAAAILFTSGKLLDSHDKAGWTESSGSNGTQCTSRSTN